MLSNLEIIARLILAAGLGSAIGFERERLLWVAGLRTHMLVCVGSCLVMIVSSFGFSDVQHVPGVVLDPSRVAAQVVSGIGFLGAGTILLRGEVVKGLTTAASLWSVAAVGLAVGGGLYVPSLAATVIILLILAGLKPVEERFRRGPLVRSLVLTADRRAVSLETVQQAAGPRASRVKQFVVRPAEDESQDEVVVAFVRLSHHSVEEIAARLRAVPGVVRVAVVETR